MVPSFQVSLFVCDSGTQWTGKRFTAGGGGVHFLTSYFYICRNYVQILMPSLPSFSENVLSMTREEVFNEDGTKIKKGLLCLWGRCEIWVLYLEAGTLVLVPETLSQKMFLLYLLYATKGSGEYLSSGAS